MKLGRCALWICVPVRSTAVRATTRARVNQRLPDLTLVYILSPTQMVPLSLLLNQPDIKIVVSLPYLIGIIVPCMGEQWG